MKQGQPLSKYLVTKCEGSQGGEDCKSGKAGQGSKGGNCGQSGEDCKSDKACQHRPEWQK